jgi:hypothetical protein
MGKLKHKVKDVTLLEYKKAIIVEEMRRDEKVKRKE